jgi:Dolichyl-phosphate-mannose-protein mannosyltransferase
VDVVHRAAKDGLENPLSDGSRCCSVVRKLGALWPRLPWRRFGPLLALTLLAGIILYRPATQQSFTVDESRWIATSRYFWTTFIERDVVGPAWQPNYLVLTQPPVGRYLIGFGLWLQGWTPEQLNGRYAADRSYQTNVAAGNLPGPALLMAARRVSFVLAVGSALLIYGVAREMAGPVAGLTAFGLTVFNPLLSTLWTRALGEAPLAFFSLLALLLALKAVSRLSGPRVGPAVGAGVALGLATATKLSGILCGIGFAAFAALRELVTWYRLRRVPHVLPWLYLGVVAVSVFIFANPLLYPDPVTRSAMLFWYRRDEMQQQRLYAPTRAAPDTLGGRAQVTAQRVFGTYASGRGSLPVPVLADSILFVAGLALLLVSVSREAAARRLGRATLFLCWLVAAYVVVVVNLGVDSSHYYVQLITGNIVVEALAVAGGMSWLAHRARRRDVLSKRW